MDGRRDQWVDIQGGNRGGGKYKEGRASYPEKWKIRFRYPNNKQMQKEH